MGWQDEYDQVEDRLAKFWENNPNGRVYTEHLSISDDHQSIVVRAMIYKDLEDINKGFDLMHAGESIRSVVVF